jgi:hypothetical protein
MEALACPCEHPNVIKFLGMPMWTSKCHQILCHPHKNHGGIHIVVEWGNSSRNVGLQHEVLSHYGWSYLITTKGVGYGRVNTTCHL